jgi:hypothetical protein
MGRARVRVRTHGQGRSASLVPRTWTAASRGIAVGVYPVTAGTQHALRPARSLPTAAATRPVLPGRSPAGADVRARLFGRGRTVVHAPKDSTPLPAARRAKPATLDFLTARGAAPLRRTAATTRILSPGRLTPGASAIVKMDGAAQTAGRALQRFKGRAVTPAPRGSLAPLRTVSRIAHSQTTAAAVRAK